jgi:hypothetical protein
MVTASMPRWFRPLLLALSAALAIGWFSPEISDPDFWWHIKTGEYILQQHSLPVPDPFAFTTTMGSPAYAGEPSTRYFNLTHEWLAQVLFYAVYRAGGFGGVVLFRAVLLALVCGIVGWVAYGRCGGFYRALAAAFASAGVLSAFAADRPFVLTFLFLAATIAILEWAGREGRPGLWLLPPLLLIWANCHGGFFLGWVVLAAWSAEALLRRLLTRPFPGDRMLWTVCAISVALSGLNPNGFRIPQILGYYRGSFLTSRLLEWAPTQWWPPRWYSLLLFGAVAVLLWARGRVRVVDWLLFAAFSVAALMAYRNVVLIGIVAPILIVSYLPEWKRGSPVLLQFSAAAAVIAALAVGIAGGSFFQLRVNPWKWPSGAADFLLAHHITQTMFNSYEYGGYLMWRLWPQERVFIDGRALNEAVFQDYARILYNHDESGGKSAAQLLDQYGVQAIVMNSFEYVSGNVYNLAPALADPKQTEWKLVYSDPQAIVFLRHPPPDVAALNSLGVFEHLEAECDLHLEHEPQYPRCARSLGQVFSRAHEFGRARQWIGKYLSLPHERDPEAEEAFRRMM